MSGKWERGKTKLMFEIPPRPKKQNEQLKKSSKIPTKCVHAMCVYLICSHAHPRRQRSQRTQQRERSVQRVREALALA